MTGFEKLGVPEAILRALDTMGYADPTPVQRAAIPVLLSGKDCLVEAETGSGKTTAFGIPVVQAGSAARGLRALILVPTRELARQVAEEVRTLGTGSPFRAVAVTGGVHAEAEERKLGGDVRAVIATPGRLLALIEERKLRIDHVELVVLDEADRMLDMGFVADVEAVLDATKHRRQTALFSATLPQEVVELAGRHMKDPQEVRIGGRAMPQTLTHWRLNVRAGEKEAALVALLRKEMPERAIVFARTRERAAAFTKLLKQAGFAADALQGKMSHEQRRHVFDLFQRGTTSVLVATDLASRGLDVPEMQLVVHVDLPDEDETYLHRSGRAARFGREGKVVAIVLPNEKPRRLDFEAIIGQPFTPYPLTYSEADLPPEPAAPVRRNTPKKAARPRPRLTDTTPLPPGPPKWPEKKKAKPRKAAAPEWKSRPAKAGAVPKRPHEMTGPRKRDPAAAKKRAAAKESAAKKGRKGAGRR